MIGLGIDWRQGGQVVAKATGAGAEPAPLLSRDRVARDERGRGMEIDYCELDCLRPGDLAGKDGEDNPIPEEYCECPASLPLPSTKSSSARFRT
jgi:hypothetical protein